MRIQATSRLYRDLSRILPAYNVEVALAEGPFEDDDGVGAHFDRMALKGHPPSKAVAAPTVDFHASIVKLSRHAAMHQPKIIYGEGQGALVALGYARPLCLEQAMMTRNVQHSEATQIGQAWGNVSAVFIYEPRMSRKELQKEKLKAACPKLFARDFPVPDRRTLAIKNQKSPLYNDTKAFIAEMKVEVVADMNSVPLDQLVSQPSELMWEHDGKCTCGRKTFLFGQCPKCLREEAAEKIVDRVEAARELDVQEESPIDGDEPTELTIGALRQEDVDVKQPGTRRIPLPNQLPRVSVA